MPDQFSNDELAKCAGREVGMRKSCYVKWDKKPLAELSPARKKEIAMMEAIEQHFKAAAEPDALVRCMIVETGGQDFVCAISDWTESGLSLGEFLRQTAGVLGDDYENLEDVLNIHMDVRTQAQLDALPEYSG